MQFFKLLDPYSGKKRFMKLLPNLYDYNYFDIIHFLRMSKDFQFLNEKLAEF